MHSEIINIILFGIRNNCLDNRRISRFTYIRRVIKKIVQWNLNLLFLKGMEKTNDECGKTINTGNYYTL
jgi:hypothetical protein